MTFFFFLLPLISYGYDISNSTVLNAANPDLKWEYHYKEERNVSGIVYLFVWFVLYFIFPYIAAIFMAFHWDRTKIMGVGLIVLAFYTLVITFFINFPGTGFVGFIIFISAGILAIRFRPKMKYPQ